MHEGKVVVCIGSYTSYCNSTLGAPTFFKAGRSITFKTKPLLQIFVIQFAHTGPLVPFLLIHCHHEYIIMVTLSCTIINYATRTITWWCSNSKIPCTSILKTVLLFYTIMFVPLINTLFTGCILFQLPQVEYPHLQFLDQNTA